MEKYFERRKDFYTHVVVSGNKKGTYNLPLQNKKEFLADYCTFKKQWFLAEKPGSTMPILVDVDISKDFVDQIAPLYERQDVLDLVRHYQYILKDNVVNVTDDHLTCFLLEKPPRLEKGRVKHGFHLHFPKIFVTIADFKELFVKFNTFRLELDDISKKCWLMYGSIKNNFDLPYKVTSVFSLDAVEMDLEYVVQQWPLDEPLFDVDTKLVHLLSIFPVGKPTMKLVQRQVNQYHFQPQDEEAEEEEVDDMLLVKLLSLLKDERAHHYQSWWDIGTVIYNCTNGSQKGLDLFHEFSKKSEKYHYNSIEDFWHRNSHSNYSGPRKRLGSLIFYCRQDNPEECNMLLNMMQDRKSIPDTEYRIAVDFKERYPDVLLYCSYNGWYIFKEHCWNLMKDESLKIVPLLIKMSDWYRKRMVQENVDESVRKKLKAVVKKLETNSTQVAIIKQMCHMYHHYNDLHLLMNSNHDLICFQNGVYDFNRLEFRDGLVTDLLCTKLPVYYRRPSEEEIQDLINFFNLIFVDKELFDYFFYITCEVFRGGNHYKIGQFWTGVGDNGKSVTQKLFEVMLGEFGTKMPTTVITSNKVKAGAASPEIAKLCDGVRWSVFEEFNEDELINHGMFKYLTGNDTLYARPLYKDPIRFQPAFKFLVICNDLPRFKGNDEATWNRVRVIPFESKFKENPPATYEEQLRTKTFKVDRNLESKFKVMSHTLAWYLIEKFKEKRLNQIPMREPEKVIKATRKYQMKSNRFLYFCQAVLTACPLEEASPFEEVYQTARQFWKIYFAQDCLEFEEFQIGMQNLAERFQLYFKKPNFSV